MQIVERLFLHQPGWDREGKEGQRRRRSCGWVEEDEAVVVVVGREEW